MPSVSVVALFSLERWDAVWRRNQHLVAELLAAGTVSHVMFVEPPDVTPRDLLPRPRPPAGVEILAPRLRLPRSAGGLRVAARDLRHRLREADLLWVNDAPFGVQCLDGTPAVHDVTDDWRQTHQPERVRRRLVAAEDRLAREAAVVVCSAELRRRWHERYGVDAALVPNGYDARAAATADRIEAGGDPPRVGYVGSLHGERLDLGLVTALADHPAVGSVHLVGPDWLTPAERGTLDRHGVIRDGAVPAAEVPGRLLGFDVLVCPHRVTPFTASLDAIKAHEYLASGRPVVATPTSGFQDLPAGVPGVHVVAPELVVQATVTALTEPPPTDRPAPVGWAERAAQFAATWPLRRTGVR